MYSFDIFDTLITRKLASTFGIFAIMQDKMLHDPDYLQVPLFVRNNFFDLRIAAEQCAGRIYNSNGQSEITVEQIYGVLKQSYQISDNVLESLIQLEVDTEIEEVCPIQKNIDKLFLLVEKGEKVILISDMYLSERTIKQMLVKVDARFEHIKLYVSADYKKRKSTGHLFIAIQNIEKTDFSDWIHIGDNSLSDEFIPQKLGITTVLEPRVCLLPIEQSLSRRYEKDIYVQRMIGEAVYCRRIEEDSAKVDSLPYKYGTIILPLIIDGYIKWILEQALSQGIDTLYFISRDGYLLKKMADWWIKKKKYPIKTKYIYGSRYTWRVPALSDSNWTIRELCLNSHSSKYRTPIDMAGIFGLGKEEFKRFLPENIGENVIIGKKVWDYIAGELENNSEFKEFILTKRADDSKLMREYLEQEIRLDEQFAFVELYGGGYTQYEVAIVLSQMGAKNIKNFYYHLSKNYSNNICCFQAYLPFGNRAANITERFFSAPDGRTIGYQYAEDGSVEPVFDDESILLNKYGQEAVRDGFDAFLNHFDGVEGQPGAEVIFALETYIQGNPDEELLEYLGDMPADASENIKDLHTYAPKLNREDIRKIYQWSFLMPENFFYEGLNLSYSLKRSGQEDIDLISEIKTSKRGRYDTAERDTWLINKGYRINHLTQYGIIPTILGHRIVLYAAGMVGKILHEELLEEKNVEIVMWVDENYEKNKELGVLCPSEIYKAEFDYIIIALIDRFLSMSVKNMLEQKGIPTVKILDIVT